MLFPSPVLSTSFNCISPSVSCPLCFGSKWGQCCWWLSDSLTNQILSGSLLTYSYWRPEPSGSPIPALRQHFSAWRHLRWGPVKRGHFCLAGGRRSKCDCRSVWVWPCVFAPTLIWAVQGLTVTQRCVMPHDSGTSFMELPCNPWLFRGSCLSQPLSLLLSTLYEKGICLKQIAFS